MQKLKFLAIIISISTLNIFAANIDESGKNIKKSDIYRGLSLNLLIQLKDTNLKSYINLNKQNPKFLQLFKHRSQGKNFMRMALDLEKFESINILWEIYYKNHINELYEKAEDDLSFIDIFTSKYEENDTIYEEKVNKELISLITQNSNLETSASDDAYSSHDKPLYNSEEDDQISHVDPNYDGTSSDDDDYSSITNSLAQSNSIINKSNPSTSTLKLLSPIPFLGSLTLINKSKLINTALIAGISFLAYKLLICMKESEKDEPINKKS